MNTIKGDWGTISMKIAFVLMAVSLTASAMTVEELKSAIAAVETGGTVEVSDDVEIAESLAVDKKLTLRGIGSKRPTIRRTASVTMFTIASTGDLTLENLIIDGNKGAGVTGRALDLSVGTMTLGVGAAIRDFKGPSIASGLINLSSSSYFVMKDGSEISGFENANWGLAVVVNRGATFDMKGGLITGCIGTSSLSAYANEYDGVVYLNEGVFNFSGGTITGNTSVNCVAGINFYSGTMTLSGDATCTNNVGGYANDMIPPRLNMPGTLSIGSDYKGWMTWYTTDRPTGSAIGGCTVRKSDGARYCYGFGRISNQKWPELVFDGGYGSSVSVMWTERAFEVNGVPCCWWEDVQYVMQQGWDCDVAVLKDQQSDTTLVIPGSAGNMTFRGIGDSIRVWRRVSGKTMNLWRKEGSQSTLRFENIILDGSGDVGSSLIYVSEGRVELGAGAVVRNAQSVEGPSAINVSAEGSVLSMEEGSVICDCATTGRDAYGTVVRIGGDSASGRCEMSGGLITNCISSATQSAAAGYGGMVYVYRGVFEMTGGKIAGNSAPNSSAGVLCYAGAVRLGGTAVIENNVGAAPDVYLYNKNSLTFFGDYRGRAGISSPDQGLGALFRVTAEEGATGAWCFFASGSGAEQGYIGKTDEAMGDGKIVWEVPCGSVGGTPVASVADAGRAIPKLIVADSDGRLFLPISLTGVATSADATIKVEFDPDEFVSAGVECLALVHSENAAPTGKITFSLPESVLGKWVVARKGQDYVLRPRRGLLFVVR